MLIGEYHHAIDPKGRAIFPAKFREEMGETFILTKGLDGCVSGYSLAEWESIEERIHSLPSGKSRNLKRFLFASAVEVSVDKQGRVLIPSSLREYAGLAKDIVTIGASSSAEIWDAKKWSALCGELTEQLVADAMDELGF